MIAVAMRSRGCRMGLYEIQVIPSAEFSARYLQRPIGFRDSRACAIADFSVRYDGRVSGTVIGTNGESIAGLIVEIVAATQAESNKLSEALTARTDVGGFFEFIEVPPGEYVVGISLRRGIEPPVLYPRTFYPGTANANNATTVTIDAGNRQSLPAPLRLPPPRTSREVVGRVVWTDGRPVLGAAISIWDGTASWRQVGLGMRTDADGRFSLVLHDGLSYLIRATYGAQVGSEWRSVQASARLVLNSDAAEPLTLVLPPLPDR